MNSLDIESQILQILDKQSPIEYTSLIKKIDTSRFPRVVRINTLLHGLVTQEHEDYKLIKKSMDSLENKGKIKTSPFSAIELVISKPTIVSKI